MATLVRQIVVVTTVSLLLGCAGIQSALDPSGAEARRIALLSWFLFGLSAAILLLVCAFIAVAIRGRPNWRSALARETAVIGGGIIFPVAVLTGLLAYGFLLMGSSGASDDVPENGLYIEVTGEQWWWRVTYVGQDGRRIESANEIRLPVRQSVALHLKSADVIHSFWVPRLAGKLDMIPGRTNVQTLLVEESGVSRGQCAEYCGGAHALMSFFVIGMPEDAFNSWLEREAAEAAPPETADAARGEALFLKAGCGSCHTVRGTSANGTIGPDLTHVGSRRTLAAAALENDVRSFIRWIEDGQHVKPGNLMPPFGQFTPQELSSLAAYLDQLR